jgi:hypothetical protein
MRSAVSCIALILLVACARSEDASTVPSDTNGLAVPVEQVRQPEGDDSQLAIGEWRESLQDDAQALEFGPAGATPLFSLRCDSRRGLVLQRHGVTPASDLPMMIVTIGNETRRLAVTSGAGTVPLLRATVPARDPFLSTLAVNSDPMTIRVGDAPPLALPPSAAIGDFISICGSGGGQAGGEDADNSTATQDGSTQAEPATAENQAAPSR